MTAARGQLTGLHGRPALILHDGKVINPTSTQSGPIPLTLMAGVLTYFKPAPPLSSATKLGGKPAAPQQLVSQSRTADFPRIL